MLLCKTKKYVKASHAMTLAYTDQHELIPATKKTKMVL